MDKGKKMDEYVFRPIVDGIKKRALQKKGETV